MIFAYDVALPAGQTMTTSATPDTVETELTVRVGSAARAWLTQIALNGLGTAITQLNAIRMRALRFTTASTGGTAITPVPAQPGAPAASASAAYGAITPGTGGGGIVKMLACGPTAQDVWYAATPQDSIGIGDAGSGDSIDFTSQAAIASMLHSISCRIAE